ncbi:NepR family anti-sigma factor [Sinorhizobium numidicum]|uniref:NepR family anti-sigma factor n=1 Tax=Sinorhizobium numidicum TaxID=680248 RepID=A0ABY8D6J9_9HYPH|nr:NepR family anti-sigma factor [Sinorhizobium numidicum]WEX78102.1 NepR family anti-sigma factor [Sinorhizobium numidicum]WEX84761.1 NepR family anti-sigma factor [Sinorhizobium numidicum]
MNESLRGPGARGAAAGRVQKTDPNARIASKLKMLYQALENEPVPQQFIELLERLDQAERAQSRD